MKTFAVLLLCAFAAVQGRSAVVKSTESYAALGENPWVVHLRIAVSTSGLLKSCVGSLIDNQWVLTAASCIEDARFIWIRYGTVYVLNPELVTENSANRIDPETGVALIAINRYVESTDNISPIGLASTDAEIPDSVTLCGFGNDGAGGPGEYLKCKDVAVEAQDDGETQFSEFDIGAPLVADGVQVGVLVSSADEDSVGKFIFNADYLEWIESETGLSLETKANNEAVLFVN